jgi:hypothetical protein
MAAPTLGSVLILLQTNPNRSHAYALSSGPTVSQAWLNKELGDDAA